MKNGVEIELQRSRWQILKMVYNMKLWQFRSDVLSISLSHFSNNFDATVRCMVSFWLHDLQPLDIGTTLEDILAEAHAPGNIIYEDRKGGNKRKVKAYVKNLARRQEYRFLQEADALYEQMMANSQMISERYGCPDWKTNHA